MVGKFLIIINIGKIVNNRLEQIGSATDQGKCRKYDYNGNDEKQ
jgi:hypothetical protein